MTAPVAYCRNGIVYNRSALRSVGSGLQHRDGRLIDTFFPSAHLQAQHHRAQSTDTKGPVQKSQSYRHLSKNGERDAASYPGPEFSPINLNSRQPHRINEHKDLTSTRPADIEEVDPPPRDDTGSIPLTERAKYLFRFGKSYLKFYKTGFKNVWTNYKEYRELKRRLGRFTLEDSAKYAGGETPISQKHTDGSVVTPISRIEYQLALRTKHDLRKLIPFSIIFAICGEFTPFAVLAIGAAIVPYTCRIPQQERHEQEKFISSALAAPTTQNQSPIHERFWIARRLRLHKLKILPSPNILNLLDKLYIHPRLIKRCDQILADTVLIHCEGGFSNLSAKDVLEYAESCGSQTLAFYLSEIKNKSKSKPDAKALYPLAESTMESLKSKVMPVLDAQSNLMLSEDWTHLDPKFHYRRVLLALNSEGPDAVEHAKLQPSKETPKPVQNKQVTISDSGSETAKVTNPSTPTNKPSRQCSAAAAPKESPRPISPNIKPPARLRRADKTLDRP